MTFKTKWEKKQAAEAQRQAALAGHAPVPESPEPHAEPVSTKEALLKSAARIRSVAVKLPTPGVVDSSLHHDLLQKEVLLIEKIAESL
jgi:hypothetical protein